MQSTTVQSYLRRYTNLPALLHMLAAKQLTLLDPKTWDDRNDSFFMSLYKERRNLKTVLALCFSQTGEAYHHWRIFSTGPAGVCVVFDRKALLAAIKKVAGTKTGSVQYLTLRNAKGQGFKVDELPFVKRFGFKAENEFRAIYVSPDEVRVSVPVPIDINCIRSVSLSPWMDSDLSASTVAAIRSIPGCAKLKVSRSTLISNEQWKSLGRGAT